MKLVICWPNPEGVATVADLPEDVKQFRADGVQKIREMGLDVFETYEEDEARSQIADAEIFYGGSIDLETLQAAQSLKWMQCGRAGMDNFFYPELRESDFTLTNVRGIYSDVISDHVFSLVLSFARGTHIFARRQHEASWKKDDVPMIFLGNTTMGIVGLGGIGLAVAQRANTFGMRVLAVDPAPKGTPDYVEQIFAPENLHQMLAQSDFVAICVPHTDETAHMIGGAAIAAMKQDAILINIGRGKVVDLKALTVALENGKLSGAGLDVFEMEPLPEDHPLWRMENVIVTPHTAWRSSFHYMEERRVQILVENMTRYLNNKPLLNVVDKAKGYVVEANQ
ncbi:MAG: D-2-hydroxyacid dehydrogenase [Candidatus Latescibacteria bacterium]|jgi:phosphoglycerate dehydrogenase-like enzyme|nr:D-2-hydroxyacid dehydrogenase [Candidatus Latescibacterota bacterium]MBT4141500.1 D-2-hydroxyacid dehydrogenase [Candidatus Latescibacterota bacterium]MBT5831063.1 D-2-hydroxyacid dehydrogenase [Candidatus Latescibacterota bacterium]